MRRDLRAGQDAVACRARIVTPIRGASTVFEVGVQKYRCGAPEGERADRKARERLRPVFGWPIARLTKGVSHTPSASLRSIPLLGNGNWETGIPGAGIKIRGAKHWLFEI